MRLPISIHSRFWQMSSVTFPATDKLCEQHVHAMHSIKHGSPVCSLQLNMARQLTPTEIRLNNITAYLTLTITLLKEINHAFHTPFIQPIINTSLSLITKVQVQA
jgi:hypothetical protein